MAGHDLIVIGASAGGVEALTTVVRGLPQDLPAAICIVLHMSRHGPSLLPQILDRVTPLRVVPAADGMRLEHGCVYVAIPDHHLLISRNGLRVVRGPRENRHRPAVDALFRSAALVYGPRVLGVVLTGALDDGTAGLLAIKRRGGLALVQDPEDALYPSMPRSAISYVAVDAVVPLANIAGRLVELADATVLDEAGYPVPPEMEHEVQIMELDPARLAHPEHIGPPSEFSCPECGGVLHEIGNEKLVRFRCRVGHAFTAENVLAEQSDALEVALWTALNTLEERISLTQRLAQRAQESGHDWMVRRFEEQLHETQHHADVIRQVLLKGQAAPTAPSAASDPGQAA